MAETTDVKSTVLNLVKNEKNEMYLFVVLTLGIVIILLLLAVRPTVLTIVRVNDEIKTKQALYESLKTKADTLSELSRQYYTIKSDVENLSLLFPSSGDFSFYMANVKEITEENGYTLKQVTFAPINKLQIDEENAKKMVVLGEFSTTITVVGERSSLIDLLSDLESLPMYPEISAVSFVEDPDEDGNISISITANIYHIEDSKFYNLIEEYK